MKRRSRCDPVPVQHRPAATPPQPPMTRSQKVVACLLAFVALFLIILLFHSYGGDFRLLLNN